MADEAAGNVPNPVAERVRLGVPESFLVVEAEEAGPGGEVGGDVRGDDPAAVDLPVGFGGQLLVPAGRLDAAGDPASQTGQFPARDSGPVTSATSLSSSAVPSRRAPRRL